MSSSLAPAVSSVAAGTEPGGGAGSDLLPYNWDAIMHHMSAALEVLEERGTEEPPWVRLWRGNETVVLEQPEWIEHTVTPGERLTQIAARYGVRYRDLREWNRIRSSRAKARVGRKLKVMAHQIPVPRQSLVHRVQPGEAWDDIAAAYRVEAKMLRDTNRKVRRLRGGEKLTVWYDPGRPWTIGRELGDIAQLNYEAPMGAMSFGRPEYGRIINPVQVPESTLYHRRSPNQLWGSSHAIDILMGAIAQFRYETGHSECIQLNAMSLRRGRDFYPHKSHQSGRDIDIHMPLLPGVQYTRDPNADEVDWLATWSLIRKFLETDEVVFIFLNLDLQRHLYEAARALGESHEALAEVIEWAHGARKRTIIRHSKGHDGHMHVRFRCGPHEYNCHGSGAYDQEPKPTQLSMRRKLLAAPVMPG